MISADVTFNLLCFRFCIPIFDHIFGLLSIRIRDVMHRFRSFARLVVHVVFEMIGVTHDVTCPLRSLCEVQDVFHLLHLPSPPVIYHGSCARSFDFFCIRFSIFTVCFCCCLLIFSLVLSFHHFLLALRHYLLWRSFLFIFSMISWYLFSSSGFPTSMFFLFGLVPHTQSCRVFLL